MERQMMRAMLGLMGGLALLVVSCGGGGGGTSSIPLATSSNQRTASSNAGSITLRIDNLSLNANDTTPFSVVLNSSNGHPVGQGTPVTIVADTGLSVSIPGSTTTGTTITALTGADGSVSGGATATGQAAGALALVASAPDTPFSGLSVALTILVSPPPPPPTQTPTETPTQGTPTVTPTPSVTTAPTATVTPTPTPTPQPCADVQTIIAQSDSPNISSQAGGSSNITAVVFDSNNMSVPRVNVLFDVQPRIASFSQIVRTTDDNGMATTTLTIPPGSNLGPLSVSTSACGKSGTVTVNIVSGVSTKPVTTVVLQADPSTVGNLSGGTINLSAAVFDSDNAPINGLDVLFITPLGRVNPLTDRTGTTGSQSGIASSVLQIPVGAPEGPVKINALAGGLIGSTTVTIVAGRVPPGTINPGVPPGEPAGITLGASPTRMQVTGTGGTELATVIGRVFDNNGNPLSGVRVHYHVVTAQSAQGAVILPVTTPVPTGTPAPTPATLCPPDDPVSVSDVAGFAVIQVHSGSQPGAVMVAACVDTTINDVPSPISEQQTLLTVTSGPVSRLNVGVNAKFSDNNDGTLLTMLSAIVTDAQGNPVEDGTSVFFEVVPTDDPTDPARDVALVGNAITNASPPCDTAQFEAQTGLPISPQPGDAITCLKYPLRLQGTEIQVRVSVAGVVNNVNGQPLALPGHIGDLEVSVAPSTISVSATQDGPAVVQASVFDANLDPVRNVRVRFVTSVGTIDHSALSGSDGVADATLTIPAGTASGTATLRVAGGGLQVINISVPIVNTGGGVTPTPGGTGQPGALRFVSVQPDTIGVRGSGLPEQSILTFQVTDALGNALGGIPVNFSIAQVSNEKISPAQALSDADGNVHATLTSGERAMSIQVTAQVTSVSPPITTRSTAVDILGGPPSQANFSLAHQFNNISGRVTFGLQNKITAFVADRFGNPVPPGTAVNFTTKSGAIGNPTTTNALGQATATLVSQEPVTDTGIVDTLATTMGERPFIDVNGNGVCDGNDQLLPVSEPFYDANCNGVYDPGEDFIDLNGNGQFDTDQGSGSPTCGDQIVLFKNTCSTFSAQTSALLLSSGSGPVASGGSRDFTLLVSDNPDMLGNPGVGNPIVGGSTVSISVSGGRGKINGVSSFTLPDAMTLDHLSGINRFPFTVSDGNAAATTGETDVIIATVTSDTQSLPAGGNGSVTLQSGITFLAAPTPTPTITPAPTATATPTPSPVPPALVPTQTTLSAGTGAPPTACNGGTQTFVVTGGSPPFAVFGGGGCISATSIPTSGGSFIFTAGDTIGNFSITVTDALGKAASAGVVVQGPPTPTSTPTAPPTSTAPPTATKVPTPAPAHIQVALFVNQAGNNGDGTLSSVISALVTDINGVAVNDGIPVDFSIVPTSPTPSIPAGASVTSPALTGQAQPCTLNFSVVPQPGDALSCVKYDAALQGTAVTIQAQVQTPSGPISDAQTIILPDLRPPTPTAIATNTPLVSATPTSPGGPTSTPTPTSTSTPTSTPTPPAGSIQFMGATPTAIGVHGSGLPEQSTLTFRVNNVLGVPIPGVTVNFALSGTGSEGLSPLWAVTDQNGLVSTAVASGTQATSVRVTATLASNPSITAQSTAVSILGAPPDFNHFSMAAQKLNIPGRVTFGLQDQISAYVNDRFGNAVPLGTSVSFITNAASVVSPTMTDANGVATATLLSEGIVPPSGVVTVLAYTHGEESFLDNNGNGVFDAGDTILTDDVPEPFIDFRPYPPADAACTVPAPSWLCNNRFDPNTQFEFFVDTNGNGVWDSVGTTGIGQGTHGVWDNNILVFDVFPVTFSGPTQAPILDGCSPGPCSGFHLLPGQSMSFTIDVHDDLVNPLAGGSTIAITSSGGTITGGSITLPDGESFNRLINGLTRFSFILSVDSTVTNTTPANITVTITSPNGNLTSILTGGVVGP
ncbi:MAG: Ig-like domain-containing protein [Candidatus Binatia bacterium]